MVLELFAGALEPCREIERYARAQTVIENDLLEVRHTEISVPTAMAIFDRQETFIYTSPTWGLDDAPALWSNNRSLVKLVQNYFNMNWNALQIEKEGTPPIETSD